MKYSWQYNLIILSSIGALFNFIRGQVEIQQPKLTATGSTKVQEVGIMRFTFDHSGITYTNDTTLSLTFPTGVSISVTNPTCTNNFVLGFGIASWVYSSASNTLVITLNGITSNPTLFSINIDSFVYPLSSLNEWPLTGGIDLSF